MLSRGRRVSEDTAIGILFAGDVRARRGAGSSLAAYQKDVAELLFGNILGVSRTDLALAAVATAVAVGAIALLNKELALVAFDREMAEAMRYPVFVLDLVLLGLITLAIVVSLRAIGNILVLAMLVTPAATARLLTDRLATMQVAAAGDRRGQRRRSGSTSASGGTWPRAGPSSSPPRPSSSPCS